MPSPDPPVLQSSLSLSTNLTHSLAGARGEGGCWWWWVGVGVVVMGVGVYMRWWLGDIGIKVLVGDIEGGGWGK